MDAWSDSDVSEVVLKWASQLGKSEVIMNCLGRSVHLDPGPMMMVQPDKPNAREFSKVRIASMVRDTSILRERVKDIQGRTDGKNTIYFKSFPGGYLSICGSHNPADLASKPIRDLFMDEVDRYVQSAGGEGNPIEIAKKRQSNFWNSKTLTSSTPGNEETSQIEPAYQNSSQEKFHVPCPHCDEPQVLEWENFYWLKDGNGKHLPETAYMTCMECGSMIDESAKQRMCASGKWIAHNPGQKQRRGFYLNVLYSPWVSWAQVADEFLTAKSDPQKLKTFWNTRLARTWKKQAQRVDESELESRVERYPAKVPAGAYLLTCGVDVQKNRIEALVQAWGDDEECWEIEKVEFLGWPDEDRVWNELESYLGTSFEHELGIKLPLSATFIDSGYKANRVYDFVRGRDGQRIFACKGIAGENEPYIKKSKRRTGINERDVDLYLVGVDPIKTLIHYRLKEKTSAGPGYIHFSDAFCDSEFFKQLTSEKVIEEIKKGLSVRTWEKIRARNEVFDMSVYSYACLKLLPPNWQEWKERILPASNPEIQLNRTVRLQHGGQKVFNKGIQRRGY